MPCVRGGYEGDYGAELTVWTDTYSVQKCDQVGLLLFGQAHVKRML
jgi:hypothetical protein